MVARRAGEGSQVRIREVLRHRLVARQAPAAGARQALWRGARGGRGEAGKEERQMERALLRSALPAEAEKCEAAEGFARAAPPAGDAALPPRVLARRIRRH